MAKRKKSNNDYFWVSYADLMTTLFFIMLTMFIVTVVYLKFEQRAIKTRKDELENILKVKEQFEPLQKENSGFIYLDNCDKYVAQNLLGEEIFEPEKYIIKPEFKLTTIKVGHKIDTLLSAIRKKNPELKYMVVLEGNVANKWDYSLNKDSGWGYETSYKRALAVYNLWLTNGIDLRGNDDAIEVLICGSGFNGLCRDKVEENNKRFSIQIIPKVKPINE